MGGKLLEQKDCHQHLCIIIQ